MSADMGAERALHPQELAQADAYTVPADVPIAAPEIEDEVADERLTVATPRQLIWWRFKKHRVAVWCGVLLVVFYVIALFAEFVAPYDPNAVNGRYKLVQPVRLTFIDPDGNFVPWPGVNLLIQSRDPDTLRITYVPDTSTWYPIQFFVHGAPYKLWGIFPAD